MPVPAPPVRAFHLDLKGVPPTPTRLLEIVSLAHASGFNAVLVEWEDQFPWKEKRYRSETAYTKAQVRTFHAHCATLGMEVIPLLQCLGHMETWLRLPENIPLREVPHLVDVLNPLADGAGPLIQGLIEEILSLTPHLRHFHLGGDEAWTFGKHPDTHAFIEAHGKAALYMRHVGPLLDLLAARGIRPILWHDMMADWSESALATLAPKADLCIWGYERYDREKEFWLRELTRRERASKLPILSGGAAPVSEWLIARFQRAGVRLWGAAAYKCGSGGPWFADLPDLPARLLNALDWGAFSRRFPLTGLIATAWSRGTTDAPQYIPIDAALDALVATGAIWTRNLATSGSPADTERLMRTAQTRAWTLLKHHGESERTAASRALMVRLTKCRHAAWTEVIRLREVLAGMDADPRRRSRGLPEKLLGYVWEHLHHADTSLRREILAHFTRLVPRVWMERYLAERIEPLHQEYLDLKHRLAVSVFPP